MTLRIFSNGTFRVRQNHNTLQPTPWITRISDHHNHSITFHTFLGGRGAVSRLDIRTDRLEKTLIIEPATQEVRTALLNALVAENFEIEPNVLADDLAIRVPFDTRRIELVSLLRQHDASIAQIQSQLLRESYSVPSLTPSLR